MHSITMWLPIRHKHKKNEKTNEKKEKLNDTEQMNKHLIHASHFL